MLRLTWDTMVVRDWLDPSRAGHVVARSIMRYDELGVCEVRVVSRVSADIPDDPLRSKFEWSSLGHRERIPSIGQFGLSRWDEDFWASEEDSSQFDALLGCVFPHAKKTDKNWMHHIKDVGHLLGHLRSKRDIFVTNEKRMTGKAEELERRFSLEVRSATDTLREVERVASI